MELQRGDVQTSELTTPIGDALQLAAPVFWRWYEVNRTKVLVRRRVLFLTLVVRVEHLYPLFVQLFGANF